MASFCLKTESLFVGTMLLGSLMWCPRAALAQDLLDSSALDRVGARTVDEFAPRSEELLARSGTKVWSFRLTPGYTNKQTAIESGALFAASRKLRGRTLEFRYGYTSSNPDTAGSATYGSTALTAIYNLLAPANDALATRVPKVNVTTVYGRAQGVSRTIRLQASADLQIGDSRKWFAGVSAAHTEKDPVAAGSTVRAVVTKASFRRTALVSDVELSGTYTIKNRITKMDNYEVNLTKAVGANGDKAQITYGKGRTFGLTYTFNLP